ncbi:MAG: 5-formyltetrahydrofolate cyclo-ligase [Nitrosopumilaceae archaeon]|nr:5-formyltetrahydrofolate cyclo-ligase [Nitrosopumilaceae archaeon]
MSSERVQEEKSRLRRLLLERRDATSAEYAEIAAGRILRRLLSCREFSEALTVGAYHPIGSEVPTRGIMSEVMSGGKELYLPRVTDDEAMEFCRVRDVSELRRGRRYSAIMEPTGPCAEALSRGLDMIIVPSIAASADGCRLGYGRGYYDRYLEGRRGAATTVCAILYEKQVTKRIPADPHDARVDMIITEKKTRYVGGRRERAARVR